MPGIINSSTSIYPKKTASPDKLVERTIPVDVDLSSFKYVHEILSQTVFVKAAGNDFPHPVDKIISVYGDKMIVVGSADPTGFPSTFSQADKRVNILAPSDEFIPSVGVGAKPILFSGTSGDAPVVSGVLADVNSLLPRDLTRDEAAHLLHKTATKTSINGASDMNGAGVVNHYKMLRVAKRLHDAGFPANEDILHSEQLFDFSTEAKKLASEAEHLITSSDAENYAEGFKKLRTAFFLNPDNNNIRSALAKIYRDCRYHTQSLFYDFYDKSGAYDHSIAKKITIRKRKSLFYFLNAEKNNILKWANDTNEIRQETKEHYADISRLWPRMVVPITWIYC